MNKFEQMLEHLINEEKSQAKELFHQLVVEKSRQIYENILAEEFGDKNEFDPETDDIDADDTDMDIGGDATDDLESDLEDGDAGEMDDLEADGDMGQRVEDLEDELESLRAEFEELMASQGEGEDLESDEAENDFNDDDFGTDDLESDNDMDMDMEPTDDENEYSAKKESYVREYTEKVTAKMGDNGAYTTSPVAKANRMGGTSANIAKGGESKSAGTKGGLAAPTAKEDNAGNVNVPGGKAGVRTLSKVSAGHGAERKGTPKNGENVRSITGSKR